MTKQSSQPPFRPVPVLKVGNPPDQSSTRLIDGSTHQEPKRSTERLDSKRSLEDEQAKAQDLLIYFIGHLG
jgi:hypothetical protein